MIKHVSFDVWGTLISANPQYAAARTELIANMVGLDQAVVKSTYTRTKRLVDTMAETTGAALTTRECFDLLYINLGIDGSHCSPVLERQLQELFLLYPPSVLDQAKHQLAHLHIKGVTMSIASNSNFVSGSLMYSFLQQEFDNLFSFGVFSDEIQYAKPHNRFFSVVQVRTEDIHAEGEIAEDSILHVGDNYICDGIGARNAGMHYVILNDVTDIQPAFRHLTTLFHEN